MESISLAFSNLETWLIVYGPTIIAVVSSISALLTAITKIKSVASETTKENAELKKQLVEEKEARKQAELRQAKFENEIRNDVSSIKDTVHHIYKRK